MNETDNPSHSLRYIGIAIAVGYRSLLLEADGDAPAIGRRLRLRLLCTNECKRFAYCELTPKSRDISIQNGEISTKGGRLCAGARSAVSVMPAIDMRRVRCGPCQRKDFSARNQLIERCTDPIAAHFGVPLLHSRHDR
jgi:hypothetical protein